MGGKNYVFCEDTNLGWPIITEILMDLDCQFLCLLPLRSKA